MKAEIVEIFKSIQGEGKYAGEEQVFVRFKGCNLRCSFCDTKESQSSAFDVLFEKDLDVTLNQIMNLWDNCHSVSLTGGEPLLHKDFLRKLAKEIKDRGTTTYLETNGILYDNLLEGIEYIDIVSMDIKLPSSTGGEQYWSEHEKFLTIAKEKDVFVKTVISVDTTKEDIFKAVALIEKVDKNVQFILQPNYFDLSSGVMDKCLEYENYCQRYLKDVKVMRQMHKILNVK